MNRMFARHRQIITRRDGLTSSIPETLVGVLVKLAVASMIGTLLVGVFTYSSTASASTNVSATAQAASISFADQARNADRIFGRDTNNVFFVKYDGAGGCSVDSWKTVATGSSNTLTRGRFTLTGAQCDNSSAVFTASANDNPKPVLRNLGTVTITYANVAGRVVTFPGGVPTLASGTQPTNVTKAEWASTNPESVELTTTALTGGVLASAKPVVLSGRAPVVVAAPATGNIVTPDTTAPAPTAVTVTVARSTTTGVSYGGLREAITVSFTGGICPGPTTYAAKFVPTIPNAADYRVYTVQTAEFTGTLTGAAVPMELDGVPNGASGDAIVEAKCAPDAAQASGVKHYHQSMPTPTWAKSVDPTSPETHIITVNNVVSSARVFYRIGQSPLAPLRFETLDTGVSGGGGDGKWYYRETETIPFTVTYPLGTAYGLNLDYYVRAFIPGADYPSGYINQTITTPITVPNAINWTWTGGSKTAAPFDGYLSWYAFPIGPTTCPAGTTLMYHPVAYDDTSVTPYIRNTAAPLMDLGWTSATSSPTLLTGTQLHVYYPNQQLQLEFPTACRVDLNGRMILSTAGAGFVKNTAWATPTMPAWAGSTTWKKTESPTTSIFDICRNLGTVTCTKSSYGDSIVPGWATPTCPANHDLTSTSMDITDWNGVKTTAAWGTAMGFETGGVTKTVKFSNFKWVCKPRHYSGPITFGNPSGTITVTINPLP
ncbi:hypothetical protein [Agromyces humi]|uniref:hypothetical protein n=1 Tax=Agromyces humi TaxID=1766800 RepID=UPI00135778CF|nr:hypothetical protein [Agromyces humi]